MSAADSAPQLRPSWLQGWRSRVRGLQGRSAGSLIGISSGGRGNNDGLAKGGACLTYRAAKPSCKVWQREGRRRELRSLRGKHRFGDQAGPSPLHVPSKWGRNPSWSAPANILRLQKMKSGPLGGLLGARQRPAPASACLFRPQGLCAGGSLAPGRFLPWLFFELWPLPHPLGLSSQATSSAERSTLTAPSVLPITAVILPLEGIRPYLKFVS